MILVNSFLVAFFWAAVFAYPIYRLLLLTKSRQTIDPHLKEHLVKQGTPTMGGIIVLAGVLAFVFGAFFGGIGGYVSTEALRGNEFWGYVFCFVSLAVVGFIDDFVVPRMLKGKRGLGWLPKIVMQLAIALTAAKLAWGDNTLGWALGTFFILFFSNAYNFVDGLDGLSGTVWLGLALGAVVLANPCGAAFAAAISGGIVAFLFLNAPPAKVFMGDVGSLPIGGCLGLMVTSMAFRGGELVPGHLLVGLPIYSLVMIAELIPVPMQVAYYKLTKKRLFPRTPIHHSFELKGWKETRIVFAFALVQILCSLVAIHLMSMGSGVTLER